MAEEQENTTELSIQDLASLRQIIDVASQRGAFKPGEMAQVGQTYNKLDAFLTEIARQQEEQKKNSEVNSSTETPEGE